MFSLTTIVLCVLLYTALLFLLARWVDTQQNGVHWTQGAMVYALGCGVLSSSHTYYGLAGDVHRSGMYPLVLPIGSTLAMLFGWNIWRRLVWIKERFQITSIADLISARYGKSQLLGSLTTIFLSLGLLPQISLQFRSMIHTTELITGRFEQGAAGSTLGVQTGLGLLVVGLMVLFTIVFGLRRVTASERNPGLISIIALQSVVKVFAFVLVGIFVTYYMFGGLENLFEKYATSPRPRPELPFDKSEAALSWYLQLFLNAFTVYFLPRQFHMAVIQNNKDSHIRTLQAVLPLLLISIGFFMIPIGLGGSIAWHPPRWAEYVPLLLPLEFGPAWLTLLVYMGGISAGMSVIIVETTAIAIMVSNHVFLPLAETFPRLGFIRRHVRESRWIAATLFILSGYVFHLFTQWTYDPGLLLLGARTGAGILQFVPAIVGGLYWRRANRVGALLGLTSGMLIWGYNMVTLRSSAPWPSPDSSATWAYGALLVNLVLFVLGSICFRRSIREEMIANQMVDIFRSPLTGAPEGEELGLIPQEPKRKAAMSVFEQYFGPEDARRLTGECLSKVGISSGKGLTLMQLGELESQVESALASSIGTASAHSAVKRMRIVSEDEYRSLDSEYQRLSDTAKHPRPVHYDPIHSLKQREKILGDQARIFKFFADAVKRFASTLELEPTIRNVAEIPLGQVAERTFVCAIRPGFSDEDPPNYVFGLGDVDVERQTRDRARLNGAKLDPASLTHIDKVLRNRRSEIAFNDSSSDWGGTLFPDFKPRASFTVPLMFGDRMMGTLSILSSESRFNAPLFDIGLAEQYAYLCGSVLENAVLYRSAREAIQAREDFMEAASHELKTPLTPLKGQLQLFTQMIRTGDIRALPRERLLQFLEVAESQLNRFVSLLNQLLDVSAINSGQFRLFPESLDVGELVTRVVSRYRGEIARAGCEVEVIKEGSLAVRWDKGRVEHVILNLLSNALKFAPGTRISVVLSESGEAVVIVFEDHGAGISKEDQERIFQRFERLPSARAKGGFGIGLYIAHQIIQAHGGTIQVRSSPGHGSTFTVRIPKDVPEEVRSVEVQRSRKGA